MSWVFIAIAVAALLWGVFIYNGLVALNQRTKQAYADIDVQLRQRQQLIPNLVETVKGYAAHEKSTFDAVINARNAAAAASGSTAQAAAEQQLSSAVGKLMALAESYPDLKANTNFLQLQEQLATVEDKIAAARRFFNNAVSEFNAAIQAFPAVLFARSLGMSEKTFFDPGPERSALEAPPTVKF